jgi:hypothetical protein
MAKYGSSRYGSGFKFGEISAISVYYNSGITASLIGYNTISISWSKFSSDPADGTITHWKLVKSYSGSLDNPDDAIMIAGNTYANFITNSLEVLSDTTGKEINYSLWVFNGLKWIACGNAYVVNTVDDNSLIKLSRWIPRVWLNANAYLTGDAVGEHETGDFLSFLSSFTLEYDVLRTYANLLTQSMSKSYSPSPIIRAKILDYGFEYEPVLGDSYHRSLVGVSNVVNAYKGTYTSLNSYITGLTHWSSKLLHGHNLMLDYNDSSFEESTGRWVASSGTFAAKTFADESLTAPANSLVLFDPITKPRLLGFGQLTTTATTAVTLTLPGSSDITLNGIGVKPNTRYVFSGWVRHRDANAATVTAVVSWHNIFGTLISTTTTPTALTTTTSWKEFTSKSDSGRNGIKSPANAAFAKVVITVTPASATSSRFAFDLFQFAEYTKSLEFQDAKRIGVAVSGDRVNYIPNGSFESGIGSWSAYNGTLAIDPTTSLGVTFRSSSSPEITSLVLTATGAAPAYSSDWMPVPEGVTLTASAWVMGSAARQATISLEFSSQATESAQSSIITDATYGQYYPNTSNINLSQFNTTEVTNVASDGTTVTYTASNAFVVGQKVTITGVTPSDFNLKEVTIASRTASQFTVTNSALGTYEDGGSAYVASTTLSTTAANVISTTAIVPPYSKDAGYPLAKVTVYFPNGVATDKFWLDGVMVTEGTSAKPFFCGTGGVVPTDPNTSTYYSVNDTKWEVKNKYNFASNPSFEDGTLGSTPTDWAPTTGTLTKVTTDASMGPLYNTHFAKHAVTSGGQITGNYYLPYPALGGEDFTLSAYVRGSATTYTMTANSVSNNTIVAAAQATSWTRIYVTTRLSAGATSGTFTIVAGAGTTYYHVDGVQAEYGRVITKFVDPLDAATTTFTNPVNTAKTFIAAQSESNGGGKSTWFYNYSVKSNRLNVSASKYTMNGTSWALKTGYPTEAYRDLPESLVLSNSFESDIGEWTLSANTVLSRVLAKGYYFSDTVTHGQAYAIVNYSAVNTTTPYSMTSDKIYLQPDSGYYASVALRAGNSVSTGDTYTLSVDFYDGNDAIMPVYTDALTGQLTTSKFAGNGTTNTSVTLSTIRSASISTVRQGYWSYLAKTFSAGSIQGAVYAKLKITSTPVSNPAGKSIHVDRIVFRR